MTEQPSAGEHRKDYLSQPSGQKLLRICLTRDSLGWSVDFFEVRPWGWLSPYPKSYLVQDLSEASWVSENEFEGYERILRNSNMKHNLRIMDTDRPGVSKALGLAEGKQESMG